jgi:hypothetical protein
VQDTLATLRHETLVHFGLNLLAPSDKTALLAAIIAAKENPVMTRPSLVVYRNVAH